MGPFSLTEAALLVSLLLLFLGGVRSRVHQHTVKLRPASPSSGTAPFVEATLLQVDEAREMDPVQFPNQICTSVQDFFREHPGRLRDTISGYKVSGAYYDGDVNWLAKRIRGDVQSTFLLDSPADQQFVEVIGEGYLPNTLEFDMRTLMVDGEEVVCMES